MELSYKIPIQTESTSKKPTKISGAHDILNRDFYELYKNTRRKPSKVIDQYNYFIKAVNGLLLTLKHLILENKNGVYISGLGYFCIEEKRKIRARKRGSLFKSDKFSRRLLFIPDSNFEKWYITTEHDLKKQANISKIKYEANIELMESVKYQEMSIIKEHNLKKKYDASERIY